MGEFMIITGFGGLILFFLVMVIYICSNRKKISPNLPAQLRVFRWVFPITLALSLAALFTLLIDHYIHASQSVVIIIWLVSYALSFIVLRILAIDSLKEWFVPFSKVPELPMRFLPRNRGQIIAVIIFFILVAIVMFGPF